MAFAKTARATILHPVTTLQAWDQSVHGRAKVAKAKITSNLVDQAGEIFETPFDPNRYLLTHATIVCSVDTMEVANVKLGATIEDGFKVNRKYSDYRIAPVSDKYINNNNDCWSRGVIGRSFQTFQGGHNFVEHVQIIEQSKGRIIDAVARDIGESVYVDILIATDKKHSELIAGIESMRVSSLSMGCSVDFTICTKCGHVAADETELCPHIKYEKGSSFYDELGKKHRVAELCGHATVDPTGGVTFIEASWVETPAFTGAVLRNILEPSGSMGDLAQKLARILNEVPVQWSESALRKVARVAIFDEPDEDEGGGEAAPAAPAPAPDRLKQVEDDLYEKVLQRVKHRVEKDLSEDAAQGGSAAESSLHSNDNLNKDGAVKKTAREYVRGLDGIIRTASSDVDLMNKVAVYNVANGLALPVRIYRIALKVGGVDANDPEQYMAWRSHVRQAAGSKPLSASHFRALLGLSRLLDRRASVPVTPPEGD